MLLLMEGNRKCYYLSLLFYVFNTRVGGKAGERAWTEIYANAGIIFYYFLF